MKINIIAAMASNRVIGINNKLPWHISEDLKRFKKLTRDKVVLMGRITHESIKKSLPYRINIVITKGNKCHHRAYGFKTIEDGLNFQKKFTNKELFVIGGESIYKQLLPIADTLYLTKIHRDFEGDTYFPEYDESEWEEVSREDINDDETVPFSYSFLKFERKS